MAARAARAAQGLQPRAERHTEATSVPVPLSLPTGPNLLTVELGFHEHFFRSPGIADRAGLGPLDDRKGYRVRAPGEQEVSALLGRFAGQDRVTGESWPTRVFRVPVYTAEQCEDLPACDIGGTVRTHHQPIRKILAIPETEVSSVCRHPRDRALDQPPLPTEPVHPGGRHPKSDRNVIGHIPRKSVTVSCPDSLSKRGDERCRVRPIDQARGTA